MQKIILSVITVLGLASVNLHAQFSGGFVAGMNFSKISGPSETDAGGNKLEDNSFKTGFHLGGRFSYSFSETFGVRGELLYSQKGTEYRYDGTSYWAFLDEDDKILIHQGGKRNTVLKVVNNYLEIPAMAYLRLGRLEIGGGGYFAYLFRSTGSGDLTYGSPSIEPSPINVALDFNYFNDSFERIDIGETQDVLVDGVPARTPVVIGAQYDLLVEPEDGLYRRTDFGLIGNLAIYLNQGLFLGFRVNYGLQDLTKTERDVSRQMLGNNNQPIFRDDFDRNVTLQASIGFGL